MYSDRSIFRRDFILLMVKVEGERLTLAMIVFDHDFERLSLEVVIEDNHGQSQTLAFDFNHQENKISSEDLSA